MSLHFSPITIPVRHTVFPVDRSVMVSLVLTDRRYDGLVHQKAAEDHLECSRINQKQNKHDNSAIPIIYNFQFSTY